MFAEKVVILAEDAVWIMNGGTTQSTEERVFSYKKNGDQKICISLITAATMFCIGRNRTTASHHACCYTLIRRKRIGKELNPAKDSRILAACSIDNAVRTLLDQCRSAHSQIIVMVIEKVNSTFYFS